MIGVREAMDRIVAGVGLLGAEEVALADALGRVLAEDVDSPITLPARTNSAMDGFAVRASDVRGAARTAPRRLTVIEEVQAGNVPSKPIATGEFGAEMQVSLTNDGPVTIIIDSKARE